MLLKNSVTQTQNNFPLDLAFWSSQLTLTKDICIGSMHQNFFVVCYKDNERWGDKDSGCHCTDTVICALIKQHLLSIYYVLCVANGTCLVQLGRATIKSLQYSKIGTVKFVKVSEKSNPQFHRDGGRCAHLGVGVESCQHRGRRRSEGRITA